MMFSLHLFVEKILRTFHVIIPLKIGNWPEIVVYFEAYFETCNPKTKMSQYSKMIQITRPFNTPSEWVKST